MLLAGRCGRGQNEEVERPVALARGVGAGLFHRVDRPVGQFVQVLPETGPLELVHQGAQGGQVVGLLLHGGAVAGDGLVELVLGPPGVAEVVVDLGDVGPQGQRPLEDGDGVVVLASQVEEIAQVVQRLHVVGIGLQGLQVAGRGLELSSLVDVGVSQLDQALDRVDHELAGPVQTRLCLILLAQTHQGVAQAAEDQRMVRRQRQRPAKRRRGLGRLALVLQRDPEVVVGFQVVRFQRDRLAIAVGRLGQLAQSPVDLAQVVVETRLRAVQLDSPENPLTSLLVLSPLVENHSQQVHRLRVTRIRRKHLLVKLLSLRQVAGLVESQSLGEEVGESLHGKAE
jgi:hypothetical protein